MLSIVHWRCSVTVCGRGRVGVAGADAAGEAGADAGSGLLCSAAPGEVVGWRARTAGAAAAFVAPDVLARLAASGGRADLAGAAASGRCGAAAAVFGLLGPSLSSLGRRMAIRIMSCWVGAPPQPITPAPTANQPNLSRTIRMVILPIIDQAGSGVPATMMGPTSLPHRNALFDGFDEPG